MIQSYRIPYLSTWAISGYAEDIPVEPIFDVESPDGGELLSIALRTFRQMDICAMLVLPSDDIADVERKWEQLRRARSEQLRDQRYTKM